MALDNSVRFASMHLSISWLDTLLYMLELVLATYYLAHYVTPRSLKALIYGIMLADTICMITVFAATWTLLINGLQSYMISEARWIALLSSIVVTLVGVVEEIFLINRCRILAQPTLITFILLAMVLMHGLKAIFNVYSGLYVVSGSWKRGAIDTIPVRYGSKITAIFASAAGTVDILIPLALCYRIYAVTPRSIAKQRSLLNNVTNAISSGGIGAIMTFVLLILFWTKSDVYYFLVLTMGRIYALTLLVNLHVSKRKASPYTLPEDSKIKKLSISAEIKLLTFSRLTSKNVVDKQLPPTPGPYLEMGYPPTPQDVKRPTTATTI
ncbi:hypothetical protein D9619_008173 [Psilocybe cf. subviscida]|uniref:Uncharacterized protein n=1 Tax=Psilocybe cf. subviscida TaxID=2480587 RepID=A0A8H5ATV3_9AGAR|nr:hypothetical protein D9619_008173 [Psilocybe cf. subviscida]